MLLLAIDVVSLSDLLKSEYSIEEIKSLLYSFECKSLSTGSSDVEYFLHEKAISFEQVDLSRTYLVLSYFQKKTYLAGYFSISNKPLVIPKSTFSRLTNSLQKKLVGMGNRTDMKNYECKGYLLGQLGKNYSKLSLSANQVTGNDLLSLSYLKIKEAHEIVGGRVLHLECEDHPKIKKFYEDNGFRIIEDFVSPNGLRVFVKMINKL